MGHQALRENEAPTKSLSQKTFAAKLDDASILIFKGAPF